MICRTRLLVCLLACGALFTCSCNWFTPKPIALTISPYSRVQRVLGPGGQMDFTAAVLNDRAAAGVRWSLAPDQCGTLANGSNSGVSFMAPAQSVHENCTATITATSVTDPTQSLSVTVLVPAIEIAFTPKQPELVASGTVFDLSAEAMYDTAHKGVNWQLDNDCGKLTNVSDTSVVYHAPDKRPHGCTGNIIATSLSDPGRSKALPVAMLPSAPAAR